MIDLLLAPFIKNIIQGILAVVAAILHATVLQPYTFAFSTVPQQIWTVTDHVALAGAGVLFSWEAINYMWHPWTGSQNAPSRLIGRAGLAILLAQSSYWTLGLMLQVNNALVADLLAQFANLGQFSAIDSIVQANYLQVWVLLITVAFLAGVLGVVFTWAMRVAELILMLALAPIAAILSMTEAFGGAWRWLVREFAAAAFSQSMWALTLVLMFWTFSGSGIVAATGSGLIGQLGVAERLVLNCFVGGAFLILSFRAQTWLKGLLFQRSGISTGDHGALELAAVYTAGKMVTGAWGAQIGQGLGQMGIGRFSEGWMRAEASRGVKSAQIGAEPQFAVPTSIARSQGTQAAMADPASRGEHQVAEAASQIALASPLTAAAQATRGAATRDAKPVGTHDALNMLGGHAGAQRIFRSMYPPNPYTAQGSEPPPNPFTGRTAQQFLEYVGVPHLPGETKYGVPVGDPEVVAYQANRGESPGRNPPEGR